MTTTAWNDIRPQVVADLGGEQTIAQAHRAQQAYVDGWRLAERRHALGLTQAEVATRMSVSKGRVSQIEHGRTPTVDVIARYVAALGGHLEISAVFADDHLLLRGTSMDVA